MITNLMKISAIITFLICVLLTGICHSYQLIGTAALSEELIAQHYTINPRLDAVIVVDRTTPTFEYQTFYCAGSADEEEGVQGRIHFLEHLMAGTGSHGPGKLNEIIVDNGGQNYAATTIHHMYLRMRFPKDKFDLAVEIDRDRYYGTLINEEVVENEKKIVLTEKSRNSANSNKKFSNRFWGLVHKKENFSGVGTEDFIKQLEPDDLKVYYENFLSHQK
ncbi:MAG: insulinase family protein, partial [Gemmatimonadetes bacterium]|nr:insulinase family protein [Gemmatimonadota bacterium]